MSTLPSASGQAGPAYRYYDACQGHWQSVMSASVTDFWALISAMGWLNALSVLMMAYWPSLLGRIRLETTVDYEPNEPVYHTTRVYWLGLAMMSSEEWVTIGPDGTHFEVRGKSRIAMMPWRSLVMEGQGYVDTTGVRATYHINWLGAQMTQTTERQAEGCILRQEAPGFSAVQELTAKV